MPPSPVCWPTPGTTPTTSSGRSPQLAPATFTRPGEPPALRVATLREQMLDCPQCLLRRDEAFIDTRLFPLRMACLRHGYWLYRDGAGSRLSPVIVPEITRAQKRLGRLAAHYGADAAVRAYDLARYYLRDDWRENGSPFWESALADRWYKRAEEVASTTTSWLPWWAVHPGRTARPAATAGRARNTAPGRTMEA
jgi:hypothetical protein